MLDLTKEVTDVRDYNVPQRDGTILAQKRVTFYLGKFGPFVETFPAAEFSAAAMQTRIDALTRELETMHR